MNVNQHKNSSTPNKETESETMGKKASAPSVNAKVKDRYPMKRGFIGNFFFGVGVLGTYTLIRFKAEGLSNIPKDVPYVIAANHQTYVDGMWIARFLPRKHFKVMCCLAGSDLETDHGLLGKLIMRVGRGIAVDRYGSPVRGLIKAKKEIEKGHVMLVHPEGTRTSDGLVADLKDGAAYMAVKANVPVLPVYISGGYDVFSRHMKKPKTWDKANKRRKKVTIHFGPVILPETFGKDAHKLTSAIQDWLREMERKQMAEKPE